MRFMRMLAAAAVMVAAVAVYAGVATGKNGGGKRHHGGSSKGKPVLQATLAPSLTTDPAFHGVNPGGAPWVLKRGSVEIQRKHRIELSVRGLIIPTMGNAGPVTSITASLYCGADSDTTAADTSSSAPLSSNGNGRIRDKSFNVPSTCLSPVVLVHPNGNPAAYIAVNGWRSS